MRCIECGSAAAARGYRRYRCRACGKQWNERTGTALNRAQYP
jgi:putative transposase